jgi:hypothetical protein
LRHIIDSGKSVYAVAKEFVLYHQTVQRWFLGFSTHEEQAKRICFVNGGQFPRDGPGFASALLQHFRTTGNKNLEHGTSLAMVRLHDGFSCRLY